jgi:glutaminyl-tRNA synthetase
MKTARPMAVIEPLKVVITNYPEGQVEELPVLNNMENPELGSHTITFSRNLYIEQEDFLEEKPNKHWKRLSKGLEVRLMNAYFIKCEEVIYNEDGSIKELHCTYDPKTKNGTGFNERKPNGTIHFVDASTALPATFNLFEPLILDSVVSSENFKERLNPNSWVVKEGFVESWLENTKPMDKYQFVRNGYFTTDYEAKGNKLIFNRIVNLKSSFNK